MDLGPLALTDSHNAQSVIDNYVDKLTEATLYV